MKIKNQTNCQFIASLKSEKKSQIIPLLIKTAMEYALQESQTDARFFFEDKLAQAKESLNEDEFKLLSLEFLKLTKMPIWELENEYLQTIFNLENEDLLTVQLEDFISHASI